MFFHVRNLEQKPVPFDVELPDTGSANGGIDFLEPDLHQKGPLHASGQAAFVLGSEEIRVTGRLKVTMQVECDRCLEPGFHPIDSDFEMVYRPVAEGYGEEISVDESEADLGFYQGNGIELNDVLREYILLALPMQRLCKEDCQGICPVCGQNRNLNPCTCEVRPTDPRWAALKSLQ
ncbi:MAG: DUF177 domain-containing protein [Acidobacteriota bacterium]